MWLLLAIPSSERFMSFMTYLGSTLEDYEKSKGDFKDFEKKFWLIAETANIRNNDSTEASMLKTVLKQIKSG